MAMRTFEDAFVEELKDVLHAEKQLLKALPKMAKKASHPQLKKAFENHLQQTEQQVARLEQVFESLGRAPRARKCEAMQGIIAEGEHAMQEDADPDLLDAMLIAAAQRAEHYEIATYGTLCTWGRLLEFDEATRLLKQTLDEEKKTDELLTEIANDTVNRDAAAHA